MRKTNNKQSGMRFKQNASRSNRTALLRHPATGMTKRSGRT